MPRKSGAARPAAEKNVERKHKDAGAAAEPAAKTDALGATPKQPKWLTPESSGLCYVSFGMRPEHARRLYETLDGEAVAVRVRRLVYESIGLTDEDFKAAALKKETAAPTVQPTTPAA